MTALELNPNLFTVIRRNKRHNSKLFGQLNANITMQPTDIIAHECLAHLTSPLLAQFLVLARLQSNEWANSLISRLVSVVGENVPETWCVTITPENAPAVVDHLSQGKKVNLEHLIQDPFNRNELLPIVSLMIYQKRNHKLNPSLDIPLLPGDMVLMCGKPEAKRALNHTLNNIKTLTYIIDGVEEANSYVWSWIHQLRNRDQESEKN